MTVKELKEKLEILIEDGKEDYPVYILTSNGEEDIVKFLVNELVREVYL